MIDSWIPALKGVPATERWFAKCVLARALYALLRDPEFHAAADRGLAAARQGRRSAYKVPLYGIIRCADCGCQVLQRSPNHRRCQACGDVRFLAVKASYRQRRRVRCE